MHGRVELRCPLIGIAVRPEDIAGKNRRSEIVGTDIFPDGLACSRDLDEAPIAAFRDQGVAIGKALRGTLKVAVELGIFRKGNITSATSCVLPDDL